MNVSIDIRNGQNAVVDQLTLDSYVFDCDYRTDSMEARFKPVHEVLRWQMNKARESIQCVKNRSQVSGAHRKIKPQKESGTRQGDGKACHFRGGGAAFKINSRTYDFKINKKFHMLAKRIVLSHKVANGGLLVVDSLAKLDLSKTKSALSFLSTIGHDRVLFVTSKELYKSSGMKGIDNLYRVDAIPANGLNVKSMLDRTLIFDVESINMVQEMLLSKNNKKEEKVKQ